MDAETTKYLGGDVEHTHLVKGLDYALLVKIREEEKQRQTEVVRSDCHSQRVVFSLHERRESTVLEAALLNWHANPGFPTCIQLGQSGV